MSFMTCKLQCWRWLFGNKNTNLATGYESVHGKCWILFDLLACRVIQFYTVSRVIKRTVLKKVVALTNQVNNPTTQQLEQRPTFTEIAPPRFPSFG